MRGLCVLLVLLASPAAAQPLGELLRQPPLYSLEQTVAVKVEEAEHKHDDTAMWVHIAALSADWSVTAVCAKLQCAPNSYGYVRGVEPENKTSATVWGLLIDGGIVYAVREWLQPDHPKLAAAILYGLGGFRTITLTHKASDLRRNTARTAPPGT